MKSTASKRACALIVWSMSGCISPNLLDAEQQTDRDPRTPACVETDDPLSLVCPVTRECDPLDIRHEALRVINWNIKATRERGLDAVIDALRALDPDLILLQEVDVNAARTGDVDQPDTLAHALGDDFDYVFAPTLQLDQAAYGIAVLSRLPFAAAERIALSNVANKEPRTALEAQLCVGRFQLRVATHHADPESAGAAKSCTEIARHLERGPRQPTLFAGDLNMLPHEAGPQAFVQAGLRDLLAEHDPSSTFGDSRIDYMFVDEHLAQRVSDARVVQTDASDHELLFLELVPWSSDFL